MVGTGVRGSAGPPRTRPGRGRLIYVEAAMREWARGGVEALVGFVGPDVEWHPQGAERPMRGPEVLDRVRALEAGGIRRTTNGPSFRQLGGCVLVHVSLRDSDRRGYIESSRTLVYEFDGDALLRVRSFASGMEAEAAVAANHGEASRAAAGLAATA